VPGSGYHQALGVERRTSLAGKATAVCAPNAVGHRFRERPVVDVRRTGHAEEPPQRSRVSVKALGQHGIPNALEARDLGERLLRSD